MKRVKSLGIFLVLILFGVGFVGVVSGIATIYINASSSDEILNYIQTITGNSNCDSPPCYLNFRGVDPYAIITRDKICYYANQSNLVLVKNKIMLSGSCSSVGSVQTNAILATPTDDMYIYWNPLSLQWASTPGDFSSSWLKWDPTNELMTCSVGYAHRLVNSGAPASVKLGDKFQVWCDFGIYPYGYMQAYHNGAMCVWNNEWQGTKGYFNCTANVVGTIQNRCDSLSGNLDGSSAYTNIIQPTTVIAACIPNCGSAVCGKDSVCGILNCGTCTNLHGTPGTCTSGSCGPPSCDAGWGNCDGNNTNGCETDLTTNSNCGSCNNLCQTGRSCIEGLCKLSFLGRSADPTAVLNIPYIVKCNFGVANLNCIQSGAGCNPDISPWEGTSARFSCPASPLGLKSNFCNLISGGQQGCIPQTNLIESTTVVQCVLSSDCDDGNPCNGVETCSGGTCIDNADLVCKDNKVCTDDSCNPGIGCVYINDNSNTCTDNNVCTTDTCFSGSCNSVAITCNDNNVCTDDSCNSGIGCVYINDNSNTCTDNNVCTTDTCFSGSCNSIAKVCSLSSDGCCPSGCTVVGGSNPDVDCTSCSSPSQCPQSDQPCKYAICSSGTCSYANNASTDLCRASSGQLCSQADYCSSGTCPDINKSSGVCRSSIGPCDKTDFCNGVSDLCIQQYNSSSTICRSSTDSCDIVDNCTGVSATCGDSRITECGNGDGCCILGCTPLDSDCTSPGECTPSTLPQCPQPGLLELCKETFCNATNDCDFKFKSVGTVCLNASDLGSLGSCKLNATCTGTSFTCPAYQNKPDGTPCPDDDCYTGRNCSLGVCSGGTIKENCDEVIMEFFNFLNVIEVIVLITIIYIFTCIYKKKKHKKFKK